MAPRKNEQKPDDQSLLLTRKSYADYEEITVNKTDKVVSDNLVSIDENFDAIGKVAFSGCSHLNPMQSVVYNVAYNTHENMLVAAPTGSGKTNVAMMTVLSELKDHYKAGKVELDADSISEKFKIIYIAPMKSLATEQTELFNVRLKKIGIRARELTGDMSLTEYELSRTHIIVTTPEKWDVVTRKCKGEVNLLSLVRLLIIDEVHLLQSDRGPVLEALVARTLRYVESSQRMTRIIGLSATLPNYADIATFLHVNPNEGLFYFDNKYRPVPLTQTFIGVRQLDSTGQSKCMDKICYDLILKHVMQSKQVMIFVHARNSTQKVANKIRELIQLNNKLELFQPDLAEFPEAPKLMSGTKNRLLGELFPIGFGIHHAGMIRPDRLLVEKLFRMGILKVLVCTATLAWGVNFPAHAVIIRGTEIYDASAGKFVDVGLLDVMQIFGRAGRPQYDTDGHAIIITSINKMDSYLKLLTNQTPIESNFVKFLTDNLNAEVVAGTVSSINDGMHWLAYTYLNVRLAQNPLAYGVENLELELDPALIKMRERLIVTAARKLNQARMCRFNEQTRQLEATDLGRIASHFYINYETVTKYNELLGENLEPQDVLDLIGEAQEFQQIKFREEEAYELNNLRRACHLPIAGGAIETTRGKVNCLLQAYVSRAIIESHSLLSDLMYIAQNATRIGRGLLEYSLRRGWTITSLNIIRVCKMIELRIWNFQSPFRHFDIPFQIITRLEESKRSIERLDEMSVSEIAKLIMFPDKMGATIKDYLKQLPYVIVEGQVKPIKSNLITLELTIKPYFRWNNKYHGQHSQSFWLWVIDEEITKQIYHSEHIKLTREQVQKEQVYEMTINLPLVDDTLFDGSFGQRIPSEYVVFAISDIWSGCDYEYPIECRKITLPEDSVAFTRVPSNLNQLPLSCIEDRYACIFLNSDQAKQTEAIHSKPGTSAQSMHKIPKSFKIEAFNILQSQVFFPIYHSDKNLLICGPAGSGKTQLADLAALRSFTAHPSHPTKNKVVFISPIEPLARLKYRDWRERIGNRLGKRVILLDESTNCRDAFIQSELVVSSSDRFYQILKGQDSENDLKLVSLIILDDLHLLGDKRASTLELLISKLNHLRSLKARRWRMVGLSNTIANCQDLAGWLGVKRTGTYNFHPATARPIRLDIHVKSFQERHYGPRMSTMNRPIFQSIRTYSQVGSTIVFVSSKKQCFLTALDLISCSFHFSEPGDQQWLNMDHNTLTSLLGVIEDENVKHCLEFGVGILHPKLRHTDRKMIEELYFYGKIFVLVCTTNYAWQSDLRAQLVIVKGTEYYDNRLARYVNYAPADIMQMLGRAGRPYLDSTGIAVLMIRDIYKEFYKKFLYEPFPIESNIMRLEDDELKAFLMSDFNLPVPETVDQAESVPELKPKKGKKKNQPRNDPVTLAKKKHCMDMLSMTFLPRRISKNPSYYGSNEGKSADEYLSRFIDEKKFLFLNDTPPSDPNPSESEQNFVEQNQTKRTNAKSRNVKQNKSPSSSSSANVKNTSISSNLKQ